MDRGLARCADAVIVLPGIMGSELVEVASGRTLWGLADLSWYWRAWTTGSSLEKLRVTDDERAGRAGRIKATRPLRFPAVAPMLRGFEPYSHLIEALRHVVPHPVAVLPFAYDWRLPVAFNARRLADAADRHLRMWRAHSSGSAEARLVLIAHSMGGLVARYFTGVLGDGGEVRATITLGTPFQGAVKATQVMNTGRGAPLPLPRRRLRHLAVTMPGLHDLLPTYRCVSEGSSARRLTSSDVVALGGDPEMAADSACMHDQITALSQDGLRTVVGVGQPTMQSLTLKAGVIFPQRWTYLPRAEAGQARTADRGGDETVYRESAAGGVAPMYLAQSHGSLAATSEVISHICAVVTEEALGPWLGEFAPFGLHVPDIATAGVPFEVRVTSAGDPAALSCRVTDAASGAPVAHPALMPRGDAVGSRVSVSKPGIYRVGVKGEAFSAVTQLVMVTPPIQPEKT